MPFLQSSFRRMSSLLAVVLAVSTLSFSGKPSINKPSSTGSPQTRGPRYVAGEVLIKMKPNLQFGLGKTTGGAVAIGIASLDKVLNRFQGEKLTPMFPNHTRPSTPGGVDLTQFYRFHYRDGSDPRSVAKVLQSTGAIQYAEPHYIRYADFTPNDPFFGQQWHLKQTKADSAWEVTKGDSSIIIGIIDTGVQWDHPDLKQNIWHNPHPGQNPNFPADSIGWDFGGLDGTPDNNPDEDRPDHGTAIAGIASAVTNNAIGVAGVGFKCKVMAVKVSQDNSRSTPTSPPFISYGYEGMVYAADNGASVINASWGGAGYSQLEQDVINYVTSEGALVVAAAGNGSSDEAFYPAGYSHVLAVAATDSTDRRPSFSNFGPKIGVSSPGTRVFSTWKQSTYTFFDFSGTSPSTPIVSGTAALIKSLHPSWTPDQIAEQIRVTADPIDNLNPGYEKQLGLGRVNAFRAVSDNTSPGLQMTSFTLSDSIGGNNDGSPDSGETIRLVGQFTDYLRPSSSAQAQLSTTDPFISITNGTVPLGAVGTLQTVTNASNPFIFQVLPSAPENHTAVVYVDFSDGPYHDYTGFSVLLNPTYKDHNINNITMTVTSKGTLAFNDFPDNLEGTGFVFNRVDEGNLLFEGAFMTGTDVAHVVDEARGENQGFQDSAFVPQVRFSFLQQSRVSNQDGFSIFTDDSAGANKIGLRINLNTFAFKNAPDNDYIILKYTLRNTTSVAISSLYVGLYFDWDVGSVGLNIATYDPSRHLGYVYDTDPNGSKTYVGAVLLSTGSPQFRAIDNDNTVSGNPWGVYDGFTKAEKWQSLSGGTTHAQEGPSDVSMVIGTGPLSIAANDSAVVGLAVLAGLDLQSLQATADAAKQKWSLILTEVQRISSELPLSFSLYQNYPNPFNPSTKIRYDLPSESHVTLVLYNLLGQEVARLVDARQSAGKYEVPYVASNVSSGVYFYRIQAGAYSEIRKMMILR
ncbi:MAG: S8 family serine peptidase [Bacteroidota bacterium]